MMVLFLFLGNGSPKGTLKDTQKSSSPYKNTQYTQKQMFPDESRRASSSVSQVRTPDILSQFERHFKDSNLFYFY